MPVNTMANPANALPAAVKYFAKTPQTALWKKGVQAKGNRTIKSGTAIANFDEAGKYKGHAAIYEDQNGLGLNVYDQWNSREFQPRRVEFRGQGLEAIQKYIDGEHVYIPRKAENRKRWGEAKNSRQYIRERNRMIFAQYQGGIAVADIANHYYLSPKTIYKILADMKRQY